MQFWVQNKTDGQLRSKQAGVPLPAVAALLPNVSHNRRETLDLSTLITTTVIGEEAFHSHVSGQMPLLLHHVSRFLSSERGRSSNLGPSRCEGANTLIRSEQPTCTNCSRLYPNHQDIACSEQGAAYLR